MIKYDYNIQRDENDEVVSYLPNKDIPKELSDVVYIQGPNSTGKSTLLNIIALAFYGNRLDDTEINRALKDKLESLLADHQKLQFEVEVFNPSNKTKLIATKKLNAPDINLVKEENGKTKAFGFDLFKKEFRLIYDIPQDPLSRLPQLLQEIRYAQQTKGRQITALRVRIKEIIDEIGESKDPKRIQNLNASLKERKVELERIKKQLTGKEKDITSFNQFHLIKRFVTLDEELTELSNKIDRLTTAQSKDKKKEQRQSEAVLTLRRKVKLNVLDAEDAHRKVIPLLKALKCDKHRIEIWQESSCEDEIERPDDYQSLRNEAESFKLFLEGLIIADSKLKHEIDFLQRLLDLLEQFSSEELKIPGTNQSISQFISAIKTKKKDYKSEIVKHERIDEALNLLKTVIFQLEEGSNNFTELKRISSDQKETLKRLKDDITADELRETKNKFDLLQIEQDRLKNELIKVDINIEVVHETLETLTDQNDFEKYDTYSIPELEEVLSDLRREEGQLKMQEGSAQRFIQSTTDEVSRLEKKEPHKYQNYLEQLNLLMRVVLNLEKKITRDYDEYVNRMIDGLPNEQSSGAEESRYTEGISKFLASKIKSIRHINKNYTVDKIDIVKKLIITRENKKIKFSDMGTGQGQGAYIQGLLNINDNKKIIALFDEVAMMDSTTLEPIFEKLAALYKANKLFIGIIVQKRDEGVKIKSLVK